MKGKNRSGLWLLIMGIFFSLMSLMYFSTASGFIKGIRSYFWESGEGTILSSNLRSYSTSGGGTVTYSIVIDGVLTEDTTHVFKKWPGNIQSKHDEWTSQYVAGKSTTIYFNRSGETSLGHWPTEYSYQFGIQGMGTLLLGLTFVCRGTTQLKTHQVRLTRAALSPAP